MSDNLETIAKLWGESERRVQLLASEGIIPKAGRSGYDALACTRAFIAHLKSEKDICNAEEIASFFGCSTAAIYKWQKQGMPRIKRGKYSKKECANWLILKWREKAEGESKNDIDEERRELVHHQKRRAKVEADKLEATAVEVDVVMEDFEELAGLVVSNLSSLPGRLAYELAQINEPGEVRKAIAVEVKAIRRQIANAAKDYSKKLR